MQLFLRQLFPRPKRRSVPPTGGIRAKVDAGLVQILSSAGDLAGQRVRIPETARNGRAAASVNVSAESAGLGVL